MVAYICRGECETDHSRRAKLKREAVARPRSHLRSARRHRSPRCFGAPRRKQSTNRGGAPSPSCADRFHETDRSGEFLVPTDKIPASSRAGNATITAVRPPHCPAILAKRNTPKK